MYAAVLIQTLRPHSQLCPHSDTLEPEMGKKQFKNYTTRIDPKVCGQGIITVGTLALEEIVLIEVEIFHQVPAMGMRSTHSWLSTQSC